tara:strand:+ start:275 stop:436 length:162 start_codon:yes stop_codon:yes gene_type:complete
MGIFLILPSISAFVNPVAILEVEIETPVEEILSIEEGWNFLSFPAKENITPED